jgi:hypothetical protein
MMTLGEWKELLHPVIGEMDKKKVRAIVAANAREYLATVAPGITISTGDLLEAMYPREIAEQSLRGDRTRNALSHQLLECAKKELADCCVKGEVSGQYMGKPKRPWVWFAGTRELCPHCSQPMPIQE